MTDKRLTADDSAARLRAAREEAARAAAELEDAEERYTAATLNGAGLDEVAQRRAHKPLEDARARVARAWDRIGVLEAAHEELQQREYEAREAAQWASVDEALKLCEAEAGALDAAIAETAGRFTRLTEALTKVFSLLPNHRAARSLPEVFNPRMRQYAVEERLHALTNRQWYTTAGARQSMFGESAIATIKARIAGARAEIMRARRPAPTTPEAA